jgi:hypothetical protein
LTEITVTFGRVDAENNVYVTDAGVERKVGQYLIGTAEEALAHYQRKFDDLESQVKLLEQRVAKQLGGAELRKTAAHLAAELKEPLVLGDIESLRKRIAALDDQIGAAVAAKAEANKELVAEALKAREDIVAKAEALANADAAKTIWKTASVQMNELFEAWQGSQKNGPKVPKADADALWKRFSAARKKFDADKRTFFASLDAANKAAKNKRADLVSAAEGLISKGADAIGDYRKLLDTWKTLSRTPGKSDDALWEKFKAAGDAIYAARAEVAAVENVEQTANLAAKQELLKEAQKIDPAKGLAEAKREILAIQQRWEKIGRVPKDKVRDIEDKLRAVESKIKSAEQDHWRKTDPAAQERSNSVITQLEDAITKLEADLAAAKAAKNTKKADEIAESIKARNSWLEVVKAASK